MIKFSDTRPLVALAAAVKEGLIVKDGSPLAGMIGGNRFQSAEDLDELLAQLHEHPDLENAMEMLSTEMAQVIQARIRFIRNNILASVEDIYEEVEKKIEAHEHTPLPFRVVAMKYPALLTSEIFGDMLTQYQSAPLQEVIDAGPSFPPMSDGELLEVLSRCGGPQVQSMVMDMIDGIKVPLSAIYDANIRKMGKAPAYPKPLDSIAPAHVEFTYIEKAVVYFLAKAFQAEPVDDVNLSLDRYNAYLRAIMNNVGKTLLSQQETIRFDANRPTLVKSEYAADGIQYTVVRERFWKQLNEKLTANQMLGLATRGALGNVEVMDDAGNLSVHPDVIARGQTAYDQLETARRMKIRSEEQGAAVRAIMVEIETRINADQFPVPQGMTKESLIGRVRGVAQQYQNFTMDKLFFLVRTIVCQGIYPESGADKYLQTMDSFTETTQDPRECATLAVAGQIPMWLVSHLTTE